MKFRRIQEFFFAFRLALSAVRRRGDTVHALREELVRRDAELSEVRSALSRQGDELGSLRNSNASLRADLDVAKREVDGVVRAHDCLCRMLESQSALYVSRAAKREGR